MSEEFDGGLHSIEAEMSAIGAAVLSPLACAELAGMLEPRHFYRPAHRLIWNAILTLYASGSAVDLFTIRDRLGREITDIGGEDYLINTCEFVPSPAHSATYAGIVLEKWERRETVEVCKRLTRRVLEGEATLSEIRAEREGIAHLTSEMPCVVRLGDVEIPAAGRPGVRTGFAEIDDRTTCKGFPRGQMSMILGGEGDGKSAFMISSLIAAALNGERILYATFADLNRVDIKQRVMKGLTGHYNPPSQQGLHGDQWSETLDEIDRDWDVEIYDASEMEDGTDVETFAAWLIANQPKRKYTVVFVDYAQQLTTRDRRATDMTMRGNICAEKLRLLAVKTDVSMVVGSQVTESEDGNHKTKWSAAWKEKAGLIVYVVGQKVKVGKSRFGPRNIDLPGVEWSAKVVGFMTDILKRRLGGKQ